MSTLTWLQAAQSKMVPVAPGILGSRDALASGVETGPGQQPRCHDDIMTS